MANMEKKNHKMLCPMCSTELTWQPTNPTYKSDEDTTHVYVCPECPFVGFEYLSKKNTDELSAHLERDQRPETVPEEHKCICAGCGNEHLTS